MQTEEATLRLGRSRVAQGSGGRPAWNHAEFAVQYRSLANHLCIGGVYVRLLLDGPAKVSTPTLGCHRCYTTTSAADLGTHLL